MAILSDEEWHEQVREMFDQRLMPDDLVPTDLLGVVEPPAEGIQIPRAHRPCCNEDFAA